MSVKNFNPTIWSDMVFSSYDNKFVLGGLANRSYEGMISQKGDTVAINEIGDPTVTAYTGATISYGTPDGAQKLLTIDQAYYAAQVYDDLDKAQNSPKLMSEITRKIGVALAQNVDYYMTGLYTDAGIVDGGTTDVTAVTSANVTSLFSTMSASFDENNVPDDMRVAVVPPWLAQKLILAKIVRDTDNSNVLAAGFLGEFLGWNVYKSNNIRHSSTTWYAPMFFRAGDTIAMAEQLNSIEAIRSEDVFADKIRALILYGAKVIRPSSLGVAYVSNGSESTI